MLIGWSLEAGFVPSHVRVVEKKTSKLFSSQEVLHYLKKEGEKISHTKKQEQTCLIGFCFVLLFSSVTCPFTSHVNA